MKNWKFLLLLFLCLVITKSLLSSLVPAPSMFSDEYEYAKMAQSFWQNGNLKVHETPGINFPPIYPIIISPAYAFQDMRITYLLIKIINAVISSLVVFPAYLLAKELMNKRLAIMSAILAGIIPSTAAYSPYILSENLFLPLFIMSTYLLYKTVTTDNHATTCFLGITTGVTIAFTFFTRTLGITLVICSIVLFFIKLIDRNTSKTGTLRNLLPLSLTLASLFFVIILKNILFPGPLLQQYFILPENFGHGSLLQIALILAIWCLIYIGYFFIATGLFPAINILNMKSLSSQRIRWFIIILTTLSALGILIAAKHNMNLALLNTMPFTSFPGRPIGRYIEYLFPLLIISGFVPNNTKINKIITGAVVATSIISVVTLATFTLLPINNGSLILLGLSKFTYEDIISPMDNPLRYLIFLAIAAVLLIFLIRTNIKYNRNKEIIIALLTFLFLTSTLLAYAYAIQNSTKYWYEGEQMQLGLWINDHEEFRGKTFLVDEDYGGKILKTKQDVLHEGSSSTIFGFWMNMPLKVGNVRNLEGIDYIISKSDLNSPIIKETGDNIRLYKVEQSTGST